MRFDGKREVHPETIERELRQLDRLARLLDSEFRVPGTNFRLGWDGIVGLIPVIGDTATLVPALYLLWRARKFGLPKRVLIRMALNSTIDFVAGNIPLIGDLFDMTFKANLRNARLFRQALEKRSTL